MTRTTFRLALVAACWVLWGTGAPASSAGAAAGHGRIAGTVQLTAAVSRPPSVADYVPRVVRAGSTPPPEIRNVVVYVKGAPPPASMPVVHAAIRQLDETFLPRVLAVPRGSTVDFPNDDPFFHNVFSLSGAASFDLGRYARGSTRSHTFDRPGIVKVYCDLHSYMNAVILVLDDPYFAVPADDGRFVIEGVPAGRYDVAAWHERIGESTGAVEVTAGATTELTFALPVLDS